MENDFEVLLNEYRDALQRYESGRLSRNYLFNLGRPCKVLTDNGLLDNEIIMFQKTVRKMIEKHELSLEQIAMLPEQLQKPAAIFSSQSTDLARIILTDASHKDAPIVVALTPTMFNKDNVNEIKSAYPKEQWVLEEWAIKNLKIWGNQKE